MMSRHLKIILFILVLVFAGRTLLTGFGPESIPVEMSQPANESQEPENEHKSLDDQYVGGRIITEPATWAYPNETYNPYIVYHPEPDIEIISPPPEIWFG